MEIPHVGKLEGCTSFPVSGSHTLGLSTQETSTQSSAGSSEEHRRDDNLPGNQSCSQLKSDCSTQESKNSCDVCHSRVECVEDMCLQEAEPVPVMFGDAPVDPGLRDTTQLHEEVLVSIRSNEDCGGVVQLLVPVAKGQRDHMLQNCEKTDLKESEPVSNGHVSQTSEEPQLDLTDLDSTAPLTAPESSRRVLDLPRIVKHKPSSITFSDYKDHHAFITESSDDGESSQEEEEDDEHDDGDDDGDDDVFPELCPSTELLINRRHRINGEDSQRRREATSGRAELDYPGCNGGYAAEGETSSKEVCC